MRLVRATEVRPTCQGCPLSVEVKREILRGMGKEFDWHEPCSRGVRSGLANAKATMTTTLRRRAFALTVVGGWMRAHASLLTAAQGTTVPRARCAHLHTTGRILHAVCRGWRVKNRTPSAAERAATSWKGTGKKPVNLRVRTQEAATDP